jgi:hypothetical protein
MGSVLGSEQIIGSLVNETILENEEDEYLDTRNDNSDRNSDEQLNF